MQIINVLQLLFFHHISILPMKILLECGIINLFNHTMDCVFVHNYNITVMDVFSSSFLSTLPPSTELRSPTTVTRSTSPPSYVPRRYISSVRIEEKPPTTTTTTTKTPPPQLPKTQPPPPPPPSYASPSAVAKKRVEPKLATMIFNTFDDIINNFIDPPIRPSVDPRHVLSHNFAPVDELPPTPCEVIQGSLPSCLDGAYIRNGPNPQFLPRGPYHLFDGDGMLHSIRISNGNATLCSRYVKTYKYSIEKQNGSPVLPNVFSGFNGLTAAATRGALSAIRILTGEFNPANGIGLANTSLAFFGNRLYALGESDLPYSIRLTSTGDVETLGRIDFDGKLFMSMTAHPKIDANTGEAFAFRYGPVPPYLTYFYFDANGNKKPDVPIFSMTRPFFSMTLQLQTSMQYLRIYR
ncbi:putative carotenoid cleavage dioxygenase 4 [Hibiscus syriacus]|uniref:Carotenoid cleavage dioxygenase 4 n=1 Tax=Hibiscus syriacus TaxID=106335 RepID=A0A6A2ZMT7_HIBSY|nr:putative carotenoid cleavage dioxygenase 4 [Hibiscus syriacus]